MIFLVIIIIIQIMILEIHYALRSSKVIEFMLLYTMDGNNNFVNNLTYQHRNFKNEVFMVTIIIIILD